MPQHTTAERRHAAVERERQREADQTHWERLRRLTGPVVGAAAGLVLGAPTVSGTFPSHPYSAASQPFPFEPDHPDPPHPPEPHTTFYSTYGGSGTATTAVRFWPGTPAWDA